MLEKVSLKFSTTALSFQFSLFFFQHYHFATLLHLICNIDCVSMILTAIKYAMSLVSCWHYEFLPNSSNKTFNKNLYATASNKILLVVVVTN